jgi:heterodisulfide reductase subunit B
MENLLKNLGAEVVDNPFKIECCGSYHTIENPEMVSRRAHRITNYALDKQADAIVLSCPLCRFNLDMRGKEAERMYENFRQIPVYYYTQLMAIAMGIGPNVCGFEDHVVDPTALLKTKEVVKG